MTCREFEHRAASLTLWELSQARDQQVHDHAGKCRKCAAWVQQQRMLAATMQTLQARTADCTAGPDVEQALLQALRQRTSESLQPETAHQLPPIAMRLSQFFEVGAYVAAGAAIVVALFLGALVEWRSTNTPVKSAVSQPSVTAPSVVADASESQPRPQLPVVSRSNVNRLPRSCESASQAGPDAAEQSEASTNEDYVALMFCDPLSCSSDAQVVRMELPGSGPSASGGEQDAQMRFADVVVGYDGVVRAIRIVN
jgi:hypothetical protein